MIEHVERPTSMDVVHELVRRLTETPEDGEAALVLSDWCGSHGFSVWAEKLKTQRNQGPGYLPVLAALRTMFGDPNTSGGETGRYTAVFGFPRVTIPPYETMTIETQTMCACRIRRMVIPDNICDQLFVHNIRVGMYILLLMNGESIPGALLSEHMPDLFDQFAGPQDNISLTVESRNTVEIEFSGAVLGSNEMIESSQHAGEVAELRSKLVDLADEIALMARNQATAMTIMKGQQEQISLLRELVFRSEAQA